MLKDKNNFDYMKSYYIYFGLILQMMVVVMVGAIAGKLIDRFLDFSRPVFFIILIILATIFAIILLFKALLKK